MIRVVFTPKKEKKNVKVKKKKRKILIEHISDGNSFSFPELIFDGRQRIVVIILRLHMRTSGLVSHLRVSITAGEKTRTRIAFA